MDRSTQQRSLTVTWSEPLALARVAQARAGIDFLRAIRDGELPPPPIAELLGMRLVHVEEGVGVFELTPAEQHFNPIGVVHGGLAATLLDSAMGVAVHALLPAGTGYTTLEIKVNLVRAITLGTGTIRATGRVVHRGGRTATAEGRLEDAHGKLYAHASTTCLILNGSG